jgi:putative MATE family efflux protein
MNIEGNKKLFTNKMILYFIIPIAIEKLLLRLLDITDNIMISHLGEDILAGLNLASQINIMIYEIFRGLVLGGMILVSQLLGRKDTTSARKIAYSLLTFLTLISFIISAIVGFYGEHIVTLLFGQLNTQTYESTVTYLKILAPTYPAKVIYICCTDLFRAMKNSKTPTKISILMNLINISCNYVFIYQFSMGVIGAALGTVIARCLCTLTIFLLLCNKKNDIYFELNIKKYRIDFNSLKKILSLGVSTATDKGMFQLGKLAVISILSTFGSLQIAANVIVSNIDLLLELFVDSVSMSTTMIIGRCVGIKDWEQVRYYSKKLMLMGILSTIITLPILLLLLPILHSLYGTSNEVWHLVMILTIISCISIVTLYTTSFTLAHILRATGDVKFVMVISILSMWVFRFGASYIIAKCFGLGVIGIKIAMAMDWAFRSIMFITRYRSGKWQKSRV